MCASYMIKQRNPQLLGFPVDLRIDDFEQYCDVVINPQRMGPVICLDSGRPVLTAMRFGLLPSWSKEPKVKFATHNARLETVDEKPVWKSVFVRRHALVPMTDFIEPIYEGQYAGNMVDFAAIDGQFIYAAAVWDEWTNKETGEVIPSFSILTSAAPPFVAQTGHDRSPVFLDIHQGREWLSSEGQIASALKDFLVSAQKAPELTVSIQRPMRPGWEKRK